MPGEFIARNGVISRGNVIVTGSLSTSGSFTTTGTITAQTLVVQTITSSISSITGSTNFGSLLANTHTFTGSLNTTGSINVVGDVTIPNGNYYYAKRNTGGSTINIMGFAPGSDTLAIKGGTSGGAISMQFQDTAGAVMSLYNSNVGIGTTSPISKLDISGSHTGGYGILNIVSSDSAIISLDSTTSSDVRIRFKQLGVDRWFAGMNTNDNWELRVANNTPRFVITQNGNVGIGTSSPDNGLLSINGNWPSGYATVKAYPTTAFSSGGAAGYGVFDNNGATRKAYFAANSSLVEVWGQQNTPMSFATNDIERMRIDANGRVTLPYQPSFYAYGVGGGSFASGNYWIFPSTQHNRGSHYNASNGIFTAPVAGVYFFAFGNLMGTAATVYRWYLRVNNSSTGAGPSIQLRMDRGGMSTSAYGWSHSKAAVVNLAAGDTVRIFSSADDSSSLFPGENNATEEYPHFMGYLIG